MEQLRVKYIRLLNSIDVSLKRYLYNKINWKDRLIIIKGQRGTGKTTLTLQYIRETFDNLEDTLYVSLDDIYFSGHSLSELTEDFVTEGGRFLFIDEVHRYAGWSQELKNIYDFYPELKIVVTGSSALSLYISNADLGRRASIYELPELSFREYILFITKNRFPAYEMEEILLRHETISMDISKKVKIIKLFREYLRYGAYPFVLDGKEKYPDKLVATINTVIDSDIPAIEDISYESRRKIRKLLLMIATASPFKVNISELSRKLGTSRDVLVNFLNLLTQGGIVKLLTTEGIGYKILRKPDKIYFSNPNLMYAINEKADKGTVRETFFMNQLANQHQISYPEKGDFLVEDKYLFEVGGKNKTGEHIRGKDHSWLAMDDIEYGHGRKVPLWLFGFLY